MVDAIMFAKACAALLLVWGSVMLFWYLWKSSGGQPTPLEKEIYLAIKRHQLECAEINAKFDSEMEEIQAKHAFRINRRLKQFAERGKVAR
jgi:hypothetical protein